MFEKKFHELASQSLIFTNLVFYTDVHRRASQQNLSSGQSAT